MFFSFISVLFVVSVIVIVIVKNDHSHKLYFFKFFHYLFFEHYLYDCYYYHYFFFTIEFIIISIIAFAWNAQRFAIACVLLLLLLLLVLLSALSGTSRNSEQKAILPTTEQLIQLRVLEIQCRSLKYMTIIRIRKNLINISFLSKR